ncbi:MAG: cation transporter, partial [Blastocatellia bacterium]
MSTDATPARAGCSLCGLRLRNDPLTGRFGETVESFCCLGCLNVYTILVESGLVAEGVELRDTELFRRSLALGLISAPDAKPSSPPSSTDVREVVLRVGGMWCTSCGWLIEHALSKEPGVVSAEVYFNSDLVNVKYCPQYMPADRIDARIRSLGYTTGDPADSEERSDEEMRDLLLRTGIAGFLWLNIMTLSVVLYVGYFERISESFRRGMPFVLMALATPVVFYSAYPIMRLAWRGIVARTVGMESLLGLGILAAYVYSSIQAFT